MYKTLLLVVFLTAVSSQPVTQHSSAELDEAFMLAALDKLQKQLEDVDNDNARKLDQGSQHIYENTYIPSNLEDNSNHKEQIADVQDSSNSGDKGNNNKNNLDSILGTIFGLAFLQPSSITNPDQTHDNSENAGDKGNEASSENYLIPISILDDIFGPLSTGPASFSSPEHKDSLLGDKDIQNVGDKGNNEEDLNSVLEHIFEPSFSSPSSVSNPKQKRDLAETEEPCTYDYNVRGVCVPYYRCDMTTPEPERSLPVDIEACTSYLKICCLPSNINDFVPSAKKLK